MLMAGWFKAFLLGTWDVYRVYGFKRRTLIVTISEVRSLWEVRQLVLRVEGLARLLSKP